MSSAGRWAAVFIVGIAACPTYVAAFPGSVRWGYGNCASCHVNPAGGGVLNAYGRQLSRELLSTFGGEREPAFGFGVLELPEWLVLGGDFAAIQGTGGVADGNRFRIQQADLEAALIAGDWTFVGTMGRRLDEERAHAFSDDWLSRRHYVQYGITPTLSVRGGRFLPRFGSWNGDPTIAVERGAHWTETYNVEANWISENFDASLTAILGHPNLPARENERGLAASAGVLFLDNRKVSVDLAYKASTEYSRQVIGTHAVIGDLPPDGYLLMETALQRLSWDGERGKPQWSVFSNWCLAKETVQGLYVLLIEELSHTDLGGSGRLVSSYGAALRWFPRPHFEIQIRWRKQGRGAVSPEYMDGFSAYLHFYP